MTSDVLKDALRAVLFRPFTSHMASGESIPVPHPEFIAYGGGRIALVVRSDNRDRSHYVDLLLAESLTIDEPAVA